MMIIRVSPPALSHLRAAVQLAGPAQPVISVQGRGAAGAAARGRRAAPRPSAAPARLGRPRGPRHADPAPASTPAEAPAGHPRHRPALAPPPDHPQVDLPQPDRTATGQRRGRSAHRAARHREQQLEIQEDPGRAAQARPPGQRIHHPPCPQGAEDPPGTGTAHRHHVAAVPARPGNDDARHGLLPRGLRSDPPAAVLPVRHGDRLPLRAYPRNHRQPRRSLDRAADPQPPDGPGYRRAGSGSWSGTGPGSSPTRSTQSWPMPVSRSCRSRRAARARTLMRKGSCSPPGPSSPTGC